MSNVAIELAKQVLASDDATQDQIKLAKSILAGNTSSETPDQICKRIEREFTEENAKS